MLFSPRANLSPVGVNQPIGQRPAHVGQHDDESSDGNQGVNNGEHLAGEGSGGDVAVSWLRKKGQNIFVPQMSSLSYKF